MTESTSPVLELRRVTFRGDGESAIGFADFSARVHGGDLVRVHLGRHQDARDAVSTLLGLATPTTGSIRFGGSDWLGHRYDSHFKMRSRIGRVFSRAAWILNLTVGDNVRLPLMHHGLKLKEARAEIQQWTNRLCRSHARAIRDCMRKRPAFVEPSMLQVCQLIRAVCGSKQLLLLERPFRLLGQAFQTQFVDAVEQLRSEGVAVIWFADDRDESNGSFASVTRTWSVKGDCLAGDQESKP
ncbi:MAG: hypothetical protein AAF802_10275 [Planctomycetota bacterium]